MADNSPRDICDYEGSTYRTDFWESQNREYEDRVERVAIRRLLPPPGGRLLEVGGGFGRLTPEFEAFDEVVVLDYSRSQLEYAREQHGDDGHLYVAANIYEMPFAPAQFDAATMVRVLHHMPDAPAALKAVREVLRQRAVFLVEYANKRNLRALARWATGRQDGSPFAYEPMSMGDVYFGFHPRYVMDSLDEANLKAGRILTVSHYRLEFLKNNLPIDLLVALDSMAQLTGDLWQYSPSVFVRTEAVGADEVGPEGAFWRCPACGSYELEQDDEGMTCEGCHTRWAKRNGVWDFKEPAG